MANSALHDTLLFCALRQAQISTLIYWLYKAIPPEHINKKFWEELIAYFPLIRRDRKENDVSSNSSIATCVLVAAGMCLPNRCLATAVGIHIQTQRHVSSCSNMPAFRRWTDTQTAT
jgi:hypothetical protein